MENPYICEYIAFRVHELFVFVLRNCLENNITIPEYCYE